MGEEEAVVIVRVRLLGEFSVVVDGRRVPPGAWTRRQAATLVKLLALSENRRLHREQVIGLLWPALSVDAAAPRLHKVAHYARRALGDGSTLLLRNDLVVLLPESQVEVDVHEFLARGRDALTTRSAGAAEEALALHGGELLPEDAYEPWIADMRDAVRITQLDLLRLAGRWEEVLDLEPTDEGAHLAVAEQLADRGDTRGALRQLERLDQALRRELGTTASPAALKLRARLETPAPAPRVPVQGRRLVGRRDVADAIRGRIELAATGRGGALVISGPPGVGKSALLDLTDSLARRGGFRSGRGSASAVEGPWPYAPVLEALGDLCRRHPALLDGLDDVYRKEIESALSGRERVWSGETGHQRLFISAAELVRLAAAGHGLVLVVDDLQDSDEGSLRLLHYLSRCAATEPVLVALAHRPLVPGTTRDVVDSLVARDPGSRIEVLPLDEQATRRLLAVSHPDLPDETAAYIAQVSGGIPFTALELARTHATGGAGDVLPLLPPAVLDTFRRVALLGTTFTTDELLALADVDEEAAYRQLELARSSLLVERAETGHMFRHPLLREALLQQLSPYEELASRRDVAERLVELGAAPSRIAHQFLAAGQPARAVPYVLRAVETAGALGAYRDALMLVDEVRNHADPRDRPRLLARRADLLLALGDPGAVAAYTEALPWTSGTDNRITRARLARAATFGGDLDTARSALSGLELEGDAADGPILMARGHLAYFSGDIDGAWEIAAHASSARNVLDVLDDGSHLVDMVSLQGLIAHQRGEWFGRFGLEMRRTHGKDRLATAVFDAHLCVAEYMLYGPVPYSEVIAETEDLRRRAAQGGALRGVAFATALIGEAALLMGDLDRAERELEESVELHRDIDATAGEAHSLQRLAEVRLAQGRREEARTLLDRALLQARWSVIGSHLLQRIHGTMIVAAADPESARAVVDRANATLGQADQCLFCDVMLAVPAAIACADVGDLAEARRQLSVAERSSALWAGTAWEAGVLEARAHLARAEGRPEESLSLLEQAAGLYERVGQRRDVERCRPARR